MKFGIAKSVTFNTVNVEKGSQSVGQAAGQVLSLSRDACVEGIFGYFVPVANDFSIIGAESGQQHFRNDPTWNLYQKERVKRFRFVICALGLCAISLALMSRTLLNVSIVDMVKESNKDAPSSEAEEVYTESPVGTIEIMTDYPSEDVFKLATTTISPSEPDSTTTSAPTTLESTTPVAPSQEIAADEDIRFDWSEKAQNILLGSFHIGYIPSMLLGGSIAERYGSKYTLFACVFGSFIASLLTPLIASISIYFLMSMRIALGLLHGGMIPSVYDLFNKWLTLAETSIWVPMLKVSLSAGCFMGSLLPGMMASFGYKWPEMFYACACVCSIWMLLWLPLATSTPQTNRFVESNELHRIMKKKTSISAPPIVLVESKAEATNGKSSKNSVQDEERSVSKSIPWRLIITHPSMLALIFVKFTYNLGMEFWTVQLAKYLRRVHDATITEISTIASAGSLTQMTLITLVGWSARVAVKRRLCGLNRTGWRKIFQGAANFSMACSYLALSFVGDHQLVPVGILVLAIHFFWMFGAGGESMVPYDLSARYPATIMGIAHGISCMSGLTIPSVCNLVLGDQAEDPARWNTMFRMLTVALVTGGIVFCLILKSKPFLPGEVVAKDQEGNGKG